MAGMRYAQAPAPNYAEVGGVEYYALRTPSGAKVHINHKGSSQTLCGHWHKGWGRETREQVNCERCIEMASNVASAIDQANGHQVEATEPTPEWKAEDDAVDQNMTVDEERAFYAPVERVPDLGTQPCSNCGYSVALHGTPSRRLCADCASRERYLALDHEAGHHATPRLECPVCTLDSEQPKSDSSSTPPAEASTKGVVTMAITDRNLEPGTKLVAKYKGKTYHATVVMVADANGNEVRRYKVEEFDLAEPFKSPSAAGTAIFGIDKAGKPRTCNGWGFWSLDTGEAPNEATTKPTGRTRRKKDAEPTTEAPVDPHAGLPIVQAIDGTFECGECDFNAGNDRDAAAAHIRETHAAYAEQAEERELATA